jgi:hypothetical protein
MKPLQSVPLTQEDWLVWLHARHGFHEMSWLELVDAYERSDRRDAELMRAWARGWPIDLGGDDEEGECLFWHRREFDFGTLT